MYLTPCSSCGKRGKSKPATLYSAWFDNEGERSAWRQKFCAPCLTVLMEPLRDGLLQESLDLVACPLCNKDASAEMRPIYLTLFVPKQERTDYALTTCESCAASLQTLLVVGAARMPNREGYSGAAAPESPASDGWSDWKL